MPLKGTTRRVIEVHGSNSCYFEKAVLYVRPECAPLAENRLAEEAKIYAAQLSDCALSDKKLRRRRIILSVLLKSAILLFSAALLLVILALAF